VPRGGASPRLGGGRVDSPGRCCCWTTRPNHRPPRELTRMQRARQVRGPCASGRTTAPHTKRGTGQQHCSAVVAVTPSFVRSFVPSGAPGVRVDGKEQGCNVRSRCGSLAIGVRFSAKVQRECGVLEHPHASGVGAEKSRGFRKKIRASRHSFLHALVTRINRSNS
jgi:hypothetical protein